MKNVIYFQTIVRVVFHERRLQYMEREQIDFWRQTRPGERIIDIGTTFTISGICLALQRAGDF